MHFYYIRSIKFHGGHDPMEFYPWGPVPNGPHASYATENVFQEMIKIKEIKNISYLVVGCIQCLLQIYALLTISSIIIVEFGLAHCTSESFINYY